MAGLKQDFNSSKYKLKWNKSQELIIKSLIIHPTISEKPSVQTSPDRYQKLNSRLHYHIYVCACVSIELYIYWEKRVHV